MDSAVGTETIIDGKKFLYFAGTGYFQLNSHPELIKSATEATLKYGIGSATSRAITGTTPLLLEIEKKLADFFGTEDAAYLPSGYLSNIAGIAALNNMNLFDVIFIDEGSHYCNIEGANVVGKPVFKFKTRDVDDLRLKLKHSLKNDERPIIVSDGLFPIWAKLAPAEDYLKIAEQHNGIVWIDDAHGVGILGENGRGTYEHLGLNSNRLYMGATLSKAFGAYGGFILGNNEFINQIKSGNVITGSSSPMNAAVAAGLKGLEIVKSNPEMRVKLWENASYLKSKMNSLGISTDGNCFPIVTFSFADISKMISIHQALMEKGIYIQYANYKGSGNSGVLRIVVFSTHTKAQIDYLFISLKEILS